MIATNTRVWMTGVVVACVALSAAQAVTVPFTEDFVGDSANWYDSAGTSPAGYVSSGGPDGGSYASTTLNFVGLSEGDTPVLFRAQDEFGSSGGAFVGDWDTAGVTEFTFYVRHNADVPLNYFVRYATPINFPGANSVIFTPVQPETWTLISIPVPDPFAVYEGPFGFEDVFTDIGHLQPGVSVPAELAGVDESFTFDIDKVSIVPEPASLLLVAAGALLARRRSASV